VIVGTINHHSDQYALSEELGNTRDLIDALSMHPLGLDPFPTCCWVVRRCMHAFPGRNTEFGEQQGAGRPVSVRACGRRACNRTNQTRLATRVQQAGSRISKPYCHGARGFHPRHYVEWYFGPCSRRVPTSHEQLRFTRVSRTAHLVPGSC